MLFHGSPTRPIPAANYSTECAGCSMLPSRLSWWRIRLQCGRPGFHPWVGKIPWRRERLPTPVFLPREFYGQRSLAGSQRVRHDWATNTFTLILSKRFVYLGPWNFVKILLWMSLLFIVRQRGILYSSWKFSCVFFLFFSPTGRLLLCPPLEHCPCRFIPLLYAFPVFFCQFAKELKR